MEPITLNEIKEFYTVFAGPIGYIFGLFSSVILVMLKFKHDKQVRQEDREYQLFLNTVEIIDNYFTKCKEVMDGLSDFTYEQSYVKLSKSRKEEFDKIDVNIRLVTHERNRIESKLIMIQNTNLFQKIDEHYVYLIKNYKDITDQDIFFNENELIIHMQKLTKYKSEYYKSLKETLNFKS